MSPPLPRVLYIDDDAALCRLIVRSLARKGFDVTSACSGPDGVALVERERFDVIAVDHYMPGRDGIATLEDLMAIEDCPPVVYVTGTDEGKIAVAALKSGAVDYIVKSADEDFLDLLASTFAQVVAQEDLRRARDRAEADLRATNQRLEALLREVNHRVANNLQMVMSFVGMQANAIAGDLDAGGAREVLRKTQARIATIAQINRRLYSTGDVESVAMVDYLPPLVEDIARGWSTKGEECHVTAEVEPIVLDTDSAVTVGMVTNELVSNACKYAYPEGTRGEIRVALRQLGGDAVELVVEDDGIGFAAGDPAKGTGLGTRLIKALAQSHGATIEYIDPARGLAVRFVLPLQGPRNRG
jgi:two-component sensor histidine kinase